MRLRMCIVTAVLAVGSLLPALAGETTPIYPGGGIEFEMKLTEKDFLPAVKQFLSAIPGIAAIGWRREPGSAADEQADEQAAAWTAMIGRIGMELGEVVAGVSAVSVTSYALVPAAAETSIADFYMQKLGLTKGWTQTLRVNDPLGSLRLYVKPDLEETFALMVQNGGAGEGPKRHGQKVIVVRSEGKVDVTRIGKLAADLAPMLMSMKVRRVEPAVEQVEPSPSKAVPDESSVESPPIPKTDARD